MNQTIESGKKNLPNILLGFVLLFCVYHLPEFLQNHFQKPLILVLESGMLLFVVISFLLIRKKRNLRIKAYGLVSFKQHRGNLMKGLCIGIGIAAFANLVPVWLHWNEISIQANWHQLLFQTLLFAVGTLLPSLAEDILTRAYIRTYWTEWLNLNWLIPVSAAIYVLNHIFRLGKPDVMLYLFILGLLLMWALVKTGTLWLTLGIHWGANISYQFFTNLVHVKSLNETGLENYLLAACYLLGFAVVFLMSRLGAFSLNKNIPEGESAEARIP